MNQQPDKLFREKLEGYKIPVPATAWEKIAATQLQRNRKGLWLKIAASVSLIAMATYLLWPRTGTSDVQNKMSAREQNKHLDTAALHVPDREKLAAQAPMIQAQPLAAVENQPTKASVKTATIAMTSKSQAYEPLPAEDLITPPVATDEENPDAISTDLSTTAVAEMSNNAEIQNITLVFTASEINEYLDKKMLAQATSEDKKPSTLMKLLKKANDLKNNHDPIGELRQKKNEILALNFKGEKQRGQNK